MLTIRDAQLRVFEDALLYTWIRQSLETAYPAQAAALGAELSTMVKAAVKQARANGFRSDHDIRRYAGLAFVLGSGFAEDPTLPWAAKILNDPRLPGAAARLFALEQAALQYLESRAGQPPEAPHAT